MSNNKQYIIVDIINNEFFKHKNGNIKIFETFEDAETYCSIYEFQDVWICELIYNHKQYEQQ
jgi:hypothetical protein